MIEDRNESISVIIPTYNYAKFIGDAIESVLEQSVKPDEIVVVDDGSTDDTKEVVSSYDGNIRYVYQENAGSAAARNTGLELAEGDLITFIDADDVWVKRKLEMQLKLLHENPDYDIIIGLLYRIPISKTDEVKEKGIVKGEYAASLGSSLMKKEVFENVGHFDEEMRMSQDIDLFFRILESDIKVLGHTDVVQFYRRHGENITQDENKSKMYHLKAFKKSLNRRRKAGNTDLSMNLNRLGTIKDFWQ